MATTKYTGYLASAATHITLTATLANGSADISSALDNSSDLALWEDLELVLTDFAAAPTANAAFELYLLSSVDGTNYPDGASGATPNVEPTCLVGLFPVRAADAAQRLILRGVQLPPGLYKYLIINRCGQALATGTHTLKGRRYGVQTV